MNKQQTTPQNTITIDNQTYNLSALNEAAQQQIANLKTTDTLLAQLQTKRAIAQTARNAYAQALASQLPKPAHPNKKHDVITIDDKKYALDDLSDQAKAELASLRVTDQRIEKHTIDLAITQTARNAYAKALSEQLPKKA